MGANAIPRAATAEECARLWPVVQADRLMETPDELRNCHATAPWRVRVCGRGEAAILGRWREHLDVLAMRDVWCSPRRILAFVGDACSVAREHGMARVLSPLLPDAFLDEYLRAGMQVANRIVAIHGSPSWVPRASAPAGVLLRPGTPADLSALADLDGRCFDEFWRYTEPDLTDLVRRERLVVAETSGGELIGYTLATERRGTVSLGRLCSAPEFRRRGLGKALLAEAAGWAAQRGASSLTLCTQEGNVASRSLYASANLDELAERYALALRDA